MSTHAHLNEQENAVGGSPYGNADRSESGLPKAELDNGMKHRDIRHEGMSNDQLLNEIARMQGLLDKYPEHAKQFDLNGLDHRDINSIMDKLARAESLLKEAQGQELQQALGKGVAVLAGGAAAVAGLTGDNVAGAELLTTAAVSKDPAKDTLKKELDPSLLGVIAAFDSKASTNPKLARILDAVDNTLPVDGASMAYRGNLGGMPLDPNLPNLVAAIEKTTKKDNASRSLA